MSTAVAPLKHGLFRTLWMASVLSATGTFIQAVAASWLMLELTGSNTWVGLMVASSTLPILFFTLATGALADMVDRAKLMLIAQIVMGGSALTMAVLTAFDLITPGVLLGLGLVLGTGVAISLPTRQALLPDLVPRGMIASAVALQSAAFNTARAVGPAIGGLLVATLGPAAGFGINSLTYLVVIAALVVIGKSLPTPERSTTRISSAIGLGIRFARFTPTFRRLLMLVSLFALLAAVVQAVLPNHTVTLGGDAGTFGVLLGAMGAGALTGAFIRQAYMDRMGRFAHVASIILFGLAGIGVGLSPNPPVAGVFMFTAGVFWLMTLTNLNATAQLISPQWIRGRAMSLYSLAFGGLLPIGAILAGITADAIGTSQALVAISSGTVLLGVFAPALRIPDPDEIETPEFSLESGSPSTHDAVVTGGPVIVLNTWQVADGDLNEFMAVMNEVQFVRLRTGAYRWRLFRNTSDPRRITELFLTTSWEEHLEQHKRIDDASVALLRKARSFDRDGGPTTRHLIAIDTQHPPNFEELVAQHDEMHSHDGSIPNFVSQADQED